jgi:hypothetical protein
MAVTAPNPQIESEKPATDFSLPTRLETIAKLAELHDEAEETLHEARLVAGMPYVGLMLPVLAVATVLAGGGSDLLTSGLWLAFVAIAAAAVVTAYLDTAWRPFAPERLHSFTEKTDGLLLFAGFAWGTGAFLVLPAGTGWELSVLFVAVPSLTVVYALNRREAAFLFLIPVAALAAFASVLVPFAAAALGTAAVLTVAVAVAAVAAMRDFRGVGVSGKAAMPPLG